MSVSYTHLENALSQATTETDARVLDPAGGGDAPISPNGRSMIMAGVMKGIALPAIVLLLFLFFDTRIRNRKDLSLIHIYRIRQKDDLSPITKGFHAFAKARTVGPAGRLFRPFSSG